MRPLWGLVLAGGESSRMKTDKGSIVVGGLSLRERAREVLRPFCERVYISLRHADPTVENFLVDSQDEHGPAAALLSASRKAREEGAEVDWLVLACDFPFVTPAAVRELIRPRDNKIDLICFESADEDGESVSQPLFAVWTPQSLAVLEENVERGKIGPNATLRDVESLILRPSQDRWLINANDPETLAVVISALEGVKSVGQKGQ